jgi:hypothetical protein
MISARSASFGRRRRVGFNGRWRSARRTALFRMSHLLLSALLIGLATAAHGQEQAAAEWIRPEAVPARADELLRRIEAAQPTAFQREATEKIEKGMADLDPALGSMAARAEEGLVASAPVSMLEDLKRDLTGAAEPLDEWHRSLEAEAERVATLLEELVTAKGRWSATQTRPETADAGEVVTKTTRQGKRVPSAAKSSCTGPPPHAMASAAGTAARPPGCRARRSRSGRAHRVARLRGKPGRLRRRGHAARSKPPQWRLGAATRSRGSDARVGPLVTNWSFRTGCGASSCRSASPMEPSRSAS